MIEIKGINHIGLASKDPAKTRWFLSEVLGLRLLGEEPVKEQKVTTSIFVSQNIDNSSNDHQAAKIGRLEVLEPMEPNSPIENFLNKKGGGIHHLALTVNDIQHTLDHLSSHGIQLIDKSPRSGVHNTKIAFVHPASTGGILIELVQESKLKPDVSI
ncbi:MAG: methylmalonyl-CoA epimerase [Bdellovibrionota bacterium]